MGPHDRMPNMGLRQAQLDMAHLGYCISTLCLGMDPTRAAGLQRTMELLPQVGDIEAAIVGVIAHFGGGIALADLRLRGFDPDSVDQTVVEAVAGALRVALGPTNRKEG